MDNRQAALELGTKPVGKLLVQYALPAVVAMLASSLYNMVDSIFIGHGVGALAISGLAVTFPFMNIMAAFGAAIGVGASSSLSVKLGQKDYKTAETILGNTFTLNLLIGVSLAFVSLVFLDPILYFFGASEQTIVYAREYMFVILLGSPITHEYFGLNAVLRASGKPKKAMYATIFTVVLNTFLDPLFIWGFDMGIRGAAVATVLSQALALMWQLRVLSNKDEMLHFKRKSFRLHLPIVRNIIAIGISPFAMNACACIVVIFINNALLLHGGDLTVGAFGISNRIAFFFFMIVMGINQGMQPIAGYNYGAQQMERTLRVLKYSVMAGVTVMTVGWLVGELLTYPCARLFTSDKQLIDITVHGLRINMLAFPVIGYQAVVTNFFQSIGKAGVSIFLSLSRQMIFLLPLLIILPPVMGVDGVWWALPISDFMAFLTALVTMVLYMRRFQLQQYV
ncbi:MAG: MATE family efflux transporter [Prevotella sp.]|nr:MATE family efflux transporter [Prevotella sp.]